MDQAIDTREPIETGTHYEPGVCNIDQKGVKLRRIVALLVGICGTITLIILFLLGVPPILRYISASSFAFGVTLISFEASKQFCVFNGLNGSYEQEYNQIKIVDPISKSVDRKRSIRSIVRAVLFGLVIGLIGLLPIG